MVQDITGHASAYRSNSFMNHSSIVGNLIAKNHSSIVEKRTFGMKYDLYKQKKHDKKKHDEKMHVTTDGFGKTSVSVKHSKKSESAL